jgi:transposase
MIAIGVDTHKRSHTMVALDAATGTTRGQLTIAASDEGTLDALRFAGELDDERVWALEDCRYVSGRLERGLLASGDRVVRVAPGLTETSRRAVREPGKSDPIDATAIARAALREGIDTLPVAFLDEQAHEIRILTDYRDQLVNERVRHINRLRWHLVQIAPDLEAQIRPAGLEGPRIRARLTRQLGQLPRSPQLRVAKAILKRICEICREEQALLAKLTCPFRGTSRSPVVVEGDAQLSRGGPSRLRMMPMLSRCPTMLLRGCSVMTNSMPEKQNGA